MLPPALLPPFSASYRGRLLAASSAFRFCASGGASRSGSLVFRVIRVPVLCFLSCLWKLFLRCPRYPRSNFLLPVVLLEAFSLFCAFSSIPSVIVVQRVLLAYGDNVRSGGGSGGPKMALL